LTQAEFDSLNGADQARVESETVRLQDQYGRDWLRKQLPRLREDLNLAYGV